MPTAGHDVRHWQNIHFRCCDHKSIYEDEDGDDNTEDDDDLNYSNVNADTEEDNGNYNRTQDEETICIVEIVKQKYKCSITTFFFEMLE